MNSVRAKLLVTMTAAVALVLVVVMGIAYWQTSNLLRDNAEEKFLLQAQQLANEIAAEKAHIESIQTSIQAITAKNQTMKRQAEVIEKQNHAAVVQAAKQAEDEALTQMKESTTASVPIVDDPWQTYGNVRW